MSVHPGRGAGRRPARSGQHARRAARVGEPRGGPARALPGFPGRLRGAVMTVLIAYGTTGGGTGEIAEWVAEELRAGGRAGGLEAGPRGARAPAPPSPPLLPAPPFGGGGVAPSPPAGSSTASP